MTSSLHRELSIWADFNSVDDQRRIKASLRFAASPEVPALGEWVRLHDDEGNAVRGVVEQVEGIIAHVRPEMTTWAYEVSVDPLPSFGATSRNVDLAAQPGTKGAPSVADGLQVN
jgi:hypothetical protein